jgi:hypothetical protein
MQTIDGDSFSLFVHSPDVAGRSEITVVGDIASFDFNGCRKGRWNAVDVATGVPMIVEYHGVEFLGTGSRGISSDVDRVLLLVQSVPSGQFTLHVSRELRRPTMLVECNDAPTESIRFVWRCLVEVTQQVFISCPNLLAWGEFERTMQELVRKQSPPGETLKLLGMDRNRTEEFQAIAVEMTARPRMVLPCRLLSLQREVCGALHLLERVARERFIADLFFSEPVALRRGATLDHIVRMRIEQSGQSHEFCSAVGNVIEVLGGK